MDRTSQAIGILKDCKAKGLSFYDARQVLVQSGFSDVEIEDVNDQFAYQSYSPQPIQPPAQTANQPAPAAASPQQPVVPRSVYPVPTTGIGALSPGSVSSATMPLQATPESGPRVPTWINTPATQVILCALGTGAVWFVGGKLLLGTRGLLPVVEFLGLVLIVASIISYYAFVVRIMVVGRYAQSVNTGFGAVIEGVIWLLALAYMALLLLRLHRWS